MKEKRSLLRRLLSGQIGRQAAAAAIRKAQAKDTAPVVAIRYPEGLYSFGEEEHLTKAQVRERATGTVYILPHNGRQ